jgi:hypothetical protein
MRITSPIVISPKRLFPSSAAPAAEQFIQIHDWIYFE